MQTDDDRGRYVTMKTDETGQGFSRIHGVS